jgi:hypothetical protein
VLGRRWSGRFARGSRGHSESLFAPDRRHSYRPRCFGTFTTQARPVAQAPSRCCVGDGPSPRRRATRRRRPPIARYGGASESADPSLNQRDCRKAPGSRGLSQFGNDGDSSRMSSRATPAFLASTGSWPPATAPRGSSAQAPLRFPRPNGGGGCIGCNGGGAARAPAPARPSSGAVPSASASRWRRGPTHLADPPCAPPRLRR